ncbi:MAG: potassium channel protein [Verrucomicrobia bacterium]|nr:potassium channel protein [Verrucomicrobiota bacterium]MBT3913094.1 potassium channel protein [Verrucomicrobiota bacterium]MBT4902790.1 potassium channel protein [Verrucomicrobiota bacterium]MBT6790688.1 potassium channel protein [Verrucomicrobiota bacterium]MBT7028180.1 potassium channel protein [Verrucomicrobiota bacterium]
MKILPTTLFTLTNGKSSGWRNVRQLISLVLIVLAFILISSVAFHWIAGYENMVTDNNNNAIEWYDGFYWTMVTMSTLGYGDITFSLPLGKFYSLVVMLFGMFSMFVILPFAFIRFAYEPWMEAQNAARTPRALPKDTQGHVILTNLDPVCLTLIHKLDQYSIPYVLLVSDKDEALRLHDQGVVVAVGDTDDPGTYRNVRVEQAAMVVATGKDEANANIAFTVRELVDNRVKVVTLAKAEASVDILELAGSQNVIRLGDMMGQFLARRTIGNDAMAHVIGHFDELLIAEAMVTGTPIVGKTLAECNFSEMTHTNVVGVWDRGEYKGAGPDTRISESTVLVLAGSKEMIQHYNQVFCIYHAEESHVVIIGGGRVGRATARALAKRGLRYTIVEELPDRIRNKKYYVHGSAARIEVLEEAKIREASTVIITTGQNDTNIYLTIYCRKLCPDIQIISRANSERNISTLHRAGADFVASYASMGANIIFNLLKHSDILMVAEGLNIFRIELPEHLEGRSLVESEIRDRSGCSVIAIQREIDGRDTHLIHLDPTELLQAGDELVLIGNIESEEIFLKTYVSS